VTARLRGGDPPPSKRQARSDLALVTRGDFVVDIGAEIAYSG